MKFNGLDISIKDYLGRMGPGIIVLLSVIYNDEVFEGMLWYTNRDYVLEIPEELKKIIGEIKEYDKYDDIINFLKKEVGLYEEIIKEMEEIT